jgi:hypothetical protein
VVTQLQLHKRHLRELIAIPRRCIGKSNSLNEIRREEIISSALRGLVRLPQPGLTASCRSVSASSFFCNGLERMVAGAEYRARVNPENSHR